MQVLQFLVADDSKTVRLHVRKAIENRMGSSKILEAADGEEAVKILKTNKIDIIMSDWDMPKMAGDELLFEVRHNKEWKDIPFIMMTSHGEKDFIVTAIQLGVSQYLVKPFTAEEMEDTIRKSWNSASKRKEQRFASLPKHRLLVKVNGQAVPGAVVNISRTGMFVHIKYSEGIKLFANYEIGIAVAKPNSKEQWTINPLLGKAVRLEADASEADQQTCFAAFNFEPTTMNKQVETTLLEFLKWLNTQGPNSIPAE